MRNLFFVVASLLFISMAQGQNVGIGTTTPPAKLTVIGSPSNPSIPNTTSTGLFRIGVSGNEGIDFGKMGSAPFAGWIQSGIVGTTAHPLSLQPIDGNVGIGTTTPSEKLEVNGAIKSTNPYYGLTQSYGGVTIGTYIDNNGGWIGTASNHPLLFFTNNSNELMALTTTGYLGIGTTSPSNMLSVAGNADFSGNVGIGTTTPGAKLEVAGTLKITGGTPGAGKVLTSDATGLASWVTFSPPASTAVFLPTIVIGTQQWMSKNLDVAFYRNGDPIPQVTDPTEWNFLTTGAWCYNNNDPTQGTTYGKLYNWYAVNDPRGLAPQGWHIPSDAEWTTLENSLGGSSVAGGQMKEAGTPHWISPNTGGNNNSGWAGLPGGYRYLNGASSSVGAGGLWWSSTEFNPSLAWFRELYYNFGNVTRDYSAKQNGLYVRCIRD